MRLCILTAFILVKVVFDMWPPFNFRLPKPRFDHVCFFPTINFGSQFTFTPRKLTWLWKTTFEDVAPIKNRDFPLPFVSFPVVYICIFAFLIGDRFSKTRNFWKHLPST